MIIRITPPQITTSVHTSATASDIKLVPNPASDLFEVRSGQGGFPQGAQIEVYNTLGQMLNRTPALGTRLQLDADAFGGSGAYVIRLSDAQGSTLSMRKLIVQ